MNKIVTYIWRTRFKDDDTMQGCYGQATTYLGPATCGDRVPFVLTVEAQHIADN